MLFESPGLEGVFVIELERHADERGFFARAFCSEEFAAHGLPSAFPQCNLSRNHRAGTLRGMHFACPPSQESKLVRCVAGAIFDVVVDLRSSSPTRFKWFGTELSAKNGRALFVPVGFGHGFITLSDNSDVYYQMGDSYQPATQRGFRWNDTLVAIEWPRQPTTIAERDAGYPDLRPENLDV